MNPTRGSQSPRRGAAAVEFALIAPILLLITFGTLEICSAIFLKEKVTIAAQEGARIAIKKMASQSDVEDAIEDYLSARGVDPNELDSGAISVSPAPTALDKLEPITVTVEVPIAGNTALPASFYKYIGGGSVSAQVVMYKEFAHPDYSPSN